MTPVERFYERTMRKQEYRAIQSEARRKINSKQIRAMTIAELVIWSVKPVGNHLYAWANKDACHRWSYLMFRHLQLMRRALHDVEWGWKPEESLA